MRKTLLLLVSSLFFADVLAQTRPNDPRLGNPFLPVTLMIAALALGWLLWAGGERLERARKRG